LEEVINFSEKFGAEIIGLSAQIFLGVVMIAEGHMSQGLRTLEEGQKVFLKNGNISTYAQYEYVMGKVYLQIVEGAGPKSLSTIARNIGFIVKNGPSAGKKAEDHFNKAIEVSREIGANCLGFALHHAREHLRNSNCSRTIEPGAQGFIQTPFSLVTLSDKLKEVSRSVKIFILDKRAISRS